MNSCSPLSGWKLEKNQTQYASIIISISIFKSNKYAFLIENTAIPE